MTLEQVYECIQNNEDRSFIGQVLDVADRSRFFDSGNGEWESGDWIECEGGRELVIDSNGVILYYDGYYSEIR
jgi:hypothetical protein